MSQQVAKVSRIVTVDVITRIIRGLEDPRANLLDYLMKQCPRPVTRKELFTNVTSETPRAIADHLRSLYAADIIGKFQVGREAVYYLNF